MAYRLTSRAERDFSDIYFFGVETFGVQQAERYAASLRSSFETIASQPMMCRARRDFRPPVRIHHHVAHAVLYLIEGGDVIIVRLLHRSQDWAQHL